MQISLPDIHQKLILHARKGTLKFTSLLTIYGFWGTLCRLQKNMLLVEWVYRLEKELSTPENLVEPKIPITIKIYDRELDLTRWPGKEEILKLRGDYGLEQFERRLGRGDLFFAALSNHEFVGFVWIQFPPVTEAGYPLQPDEAYTHDGWTFAPYRGMRVLPVLQQAVMDYVRQNRIDLRRLVTHIATWNKASIAGDQRAGYVIVRRELSIMILGFFRRLLLA